MLLCVVQRDKSVYDANGDSPRQQQQQTRKNNSSANKQLQSLCVRSPECHAPRSRRPGKPSQPASSLQRCDRSIACGLSPTNSAEFERFETDQWPVCERQSGVFDDDSDVPISWCNMAQSVLRMYPAVHQARRSALHGQQGIWALLVFCSHS